MKIGDKELGKDGLVIVCEAGSTTRGNPEIAMRLADAAKEAGADAIKFIFSDADELIADRSLQYEGKSLYETIKSYEISSDGWSRVVGHCDNIGLTWVSSIGTPNLVKMAVELGCPLLRVGAWDCRNFPLLKTMCETGLPIKIAVGCMVDGEVYTLLETIPHGRVTLMYESHSPNPKEWNLQSIDYLTQISGCSVGYSSQGRESLSDQLAVGLFQVPFIEKRIRLDDSGMHHEDKAISPDELLGWVDMIRNVGFMDWPKDDTLESQMLGRYGLFPSLSDISQKSLYLTSMVFNGDWLKGTIVTEDKIAARRPGTGLSPLYQYCFLGKTLARDVQHNELVSADAVGG